MTRMIPSTIHSTVQSDAGLANEAEAEPEDLGEDWAAE